MANARGLGREIILKGSALAMGGPHSRISLPSFARLLLVAHAGCRCSMSSLGTLGGARAGLGLLLGTAAGLGFLCALYSQRWKRTQRRGQSQSQSNSLDYTQTSEPGRQGRSGAIEASVTVEGVGLGSGLLVAEPAGQDNRGKTRGVGAGPESFKFGESLSKRKSSLPLLSSFSCDPRKVYSEKA